MEKDSHDEFYRPFFVVHLNGERNFESLRIQDEFLYKITEEVPDTVTLRGPWGGSWPIKVHQKYNGTFLVEGWQKFQMDNSLVSGGFLLFSYCGKWCFDVEIYGHDGMKIRDEGEGETSASGSKRKRGRYDPLKDQASKFPPS